MDIFIFGSSDRLPPVAIQWQWQGPLPLPLSGFSRPRPATVFGGAMALQYVVQALGWMLRYELVLMIPYVLTLVALGAFGKGSAPAMLGRTALILAT